MSDYCQGIGSRLDLTEEEFMEEHQRYVREVLDFEQLWNSGRWKMVFANWMSIAVAMGDEVLVEDSKAMLERELRIKNYELGDKDKGMYGKVLGQMTSLFYQYGKEGLLVQLGIEDLLAPGNKAPKLYQSDGVTIVPLNTLIFFYESDCNNCENELMQLRESYPILQGRNLRVITVSADTDETVYKKNADLFPWQQKICDYKGFGGVNFKNYNIIGTPMIFMIDRSGIITGRYAKMSEFISEIINN